MIAELLFLLGIEYQEDESRTVCGIVAGLLHYTFLSKFLRLRSKYRILFICTVYYNNNQSNFGFLKHVQALSLRLPDINRINAL